MAQTGQTRIQSEPIDRCLKPSYNSIEDKRKWSLIFRRDSLGMPLKKVVKDISYDLTIFKFRQRERRRGSAATTSKESQLLSQNI